MTVQTDDPQLLYAALSTAYAPIDDVLVVLRWSIDRFRAAVAACPGAFDLVDKRRRGSCNRHYLGVVAYSHVRRVEQQVELGDPAVATWLTDCTTTVEQGTLF